MSSRNLVAGVGVVALLVMVTLGCGGGQQGTPAVPEDDAMAENLAKYTPVRLTTDLGALTENERSMIPHLIEAATAMDEVFWMQSYGDRDELLNSIDDPAARRFAEINYGPWDRLDDNRPFLSGVGSKPEGARFYPEDMTREEFDAACAASPEAANELKSLYTVVVRDEAGKLAAVPYHRAYPTQTDHAARALLEASKFAEDPGLQRYLDLRANALATDDYRDSDVAWLDMKDNVLDIVVGPIENYEDEMFGLKAAHEAYVLVKDRVWSEKLSRYAKFLPELQRGLPVPDAYKQEEPGSDSDLNAYDVVYYAGHCNAGSKTIAINLPNDETIQLEKGTRRLQLKNAMRAKFDNILVPLAGRMIDESQQQHIVFDSFFENIMFHEVAHGLGIKNTLDGEGTVRDALREQTGAIEEAKADILGLYMVTELHGRGELGDADLMDNYVTYLAGIFRSTRFGAASAHGRANLAQFEFFRNMGAFTRDDTAGRYLVEFDRMQEAVAAMARKILTIQGDGAYDAAVALLPEASAMDPKLRSDLDALSSAGIPVDIVFEQGMSVLEGGA